MTDFPSRLRNTGEYLSTFGLAVLQSDETIEHDFQRLLPVDKTRQYVTKVPNGQDVNTGSLSAMVDTLPAAVGLFPGAVHLDVVGYGCTSATSVIGADAVAKLISSNCDCSLVTDPLSAAIAACRHLKLEHLAILSPYVEEVSTSLRFSFENAGIQVPVFGSFNEANDSRAANIDRQSIVDAAIELGSDQSVEGVFISCTSLKTLDAIAQIEEQISKPVLASNTVLAWHMCLLAGIELNHNGFGNLLRGGR